MPSREEYAQIILASGANRRERIINRQKDLITKKALDSPSYKETLVNGVPQGLEVMSTDFPNKKTFKTLPNEVIHLGDIIVWKNLHWLVIEVDFDDDIFMKGTIVQCNRIIKWQNPETLDIVERWCLCEKPYTSNLSKDSVMSVSKREFKIQLSYDDETSKIDLGKRFMLEKINETPRTYEVTCVDGLTNRYEDINGGFLIWNLTQDEANHSNDNADLWICDYIEPNTYSDGDLLKCSINGSPTIKCGGSSRRYSPIFYLADEITVDDTVIPNWEISVNSIYNEYISFTQNGRLIDISVADNNEIIGQTISIKLSDDNGLYSPTTFNIKVVSLYG